MKNKCHIRVESIERKGEIACSKQFLLFSQCFPQLCIFGASKCGIVWKWVKKTDSQFEVQMYSPSPICKLSTCPSVQS